MLGWSSNRSIGSGEEDLWRVYTIYGRGDHLGHVNQMQKTNFGSPYPRRLYVKVVFYRPSGFREDVWALWTTEGRTPEHGYAISSPMSLWLRWACNYISSSAFIYGLSTIVPVIYVQIDTTKHLPVQLLQDNWSLYLNSDDHSFYFCSRLSAVADNLLFGSGTCSEIIDFVLFTSVIKHWYKGQALDFGMKEVSFFD